MENGMPPEVAAYFANGRRRIVSIHPHAEDYTLSLFFDNGEHRRYDVKPIIERGGLGSCLKDKARFNRVRLDETGAVAWDIDPDVDSNVVWENVIDLCPDSCYIYSTPEIAQSP